MALPNEQGARIILLAKALTDAATALEESRWHDCELLSLKAARESRLILLAERAAERERRLLREEREAAAKEAKGK